MSRHGRTLSPTMSSSSHVTSSNSFPRIVSRVAIVGIADKEEGGASIQLYLKLSVPVDAATSNTTIPLFAEDNIKILESKVHPLDATGAPYFYAKNTSPLLHPAIRALSLPIPTTKTYLSQFDQQESSPHFSPQIMGEYHTGQILVSGYNVSYTLPKAFPPRRVYESNTPSRRPSLNLGTSSHFQQFVVALDIWVSYISQPPRAPFALSLPVPRCLSNTIDLRLFPANPPSRSFESLDSGESASWDLTCDPAVSPSTRMSISYHEHDSEDNRGDGEDIVGTFPSCDKLRIRWAAPDRGAIAADGRKRVGTNDVKGEMSAVVLDQDERGVTLGLEYKATCRDLWYPGVATLLGLDVSLTAKGSHIEWAPGGAKKWNVNGTLGFEGFDTGPSAQPRQASADMFISPSSPNGRLSSLELPLRKGLSSNHSSTFSSVGSFKASLLRAPLPAANVVDYSFEGAAAVPAASLASLAPSSTLSSISSLDKPSSDEISLLDDNAPGTITIHVNMNELLPPAKNILTFTVSGTILVIPQARIRSDYRSGYFGSNNGSRSGSSSSSPTHDDSNVPQAFFLPKFTVLAADVENTIINLKNNTAHSDVDVFSLAGNLSHPQTRKTVLQKGGTANCGNDGARIALRTLPEPTHRYSTMQMKNVEDDARQPSAEQVSRKKQAPINGTPRKVSSSSSVKSTPQARPVTLPIVASPLLPETLELATHVPARRRLLAPKMIPAVAVEVKLLSLQTYAVRMSLSTPPEQALEFGLALRHVKALTKKPKVEVICASVDGCPVQYNSNGDDEDEFDQRKLDDERAMTFEIGGKQEWARWVKVETHGGGNLVFEYMVREGSVDSLMKPDVKGKGKPPNNSVDILLPTFAIPVGRLDITIENNAGCNITDLRTNLAHQLQLGPEHSHVHSPRVAHYLLPAFFYAHLSFDAQFPRTSRFASLSSQNTLIQLLLFAIMMSTWALARELSTMRSRMDASTSTIVYQTQSGPTPTNLPSIDWWVDDNRTPHEAYWPMEPSTSSQHSDTESLLPPQPQAISLVSGFPSLWPIELDLDFEMTARKAVNFMIHSLGFVWKVLRSVYHYPLDSDS